MEAKYLDAYRDWRSSHNPRIMLPSEIWVAACESRQPEIDAKDTRIREIEAGLRDCIDAMQEWAGYASEYFREKHNLKRDVEEFEGILKGSKG